MHVGKSTGFSNYSDKEKLDGIVGDIREAVLDYQVCSQVSHSRLA